ncbi:unnamed protein product [Calypogeia fissa]
MESDPLTVGQVAFFLGVMPLLTAWMYSEILQRRPVPVKEHSGGGAEDREMEVLLDTGFVGSKAVVPSVRTQLLKFLTMNETFLMENCGTLRAIAEFVGLLFFFFVCDRTSLLGESEKSYSRDLFMFLYCLLIIASAFTSLKKHVKDSALSVPSILYLNRHQTEEWKGWMQVLFLMYHYFDAREIYNSIRVFIAAYVWMTGFGNFSYYYVRKDFSLGRFAQMMWRLNFLVFFACVLLNNDYVLYYICPMHTFFTLLVFGVLAIGHKYNEVPSIMAIKFGVSFAIIAIMFEIPGVFDFVWTPFTFLIGYKDPNQTDDKVSLLHEWHFRAGLDRYIWIFGMLYAYFHPMVERWLEKLEELEYRVRLAVKAVIISITLAVGYLWYEHVYKLDKFSYNRVHPFTSWIPITVYIVLRNFSQTLRNWSLTLFAWLGKITLETYIAQFHIWLRTGIPNGAPKKLLSIIPAYPLLNFMLTTSLYVLISYRLFMLTNKLKTVFVPHNDNQRLGHIFLAGVVVFASLYGISFFLVMVPRILTFYT